MQRFLSVFSPLKIQTKLVVYYVTFAVITVTAVIYFAYTQAVQSLQATVEDKLNTVAELKEDGLSQWVDEQQRNAVFLANLPELRSLSGKLLDPDLSIQSRDLARGELTKLRAGQGDPPHPRCEVHHPNDLDLPQGQRVHGEPA